MIKKIQQLSTSVKALLAIGGISVLAGGGVITCLLHFESQKTRLT